MKYKMPTKSDLKGRSSTISNAFAISVTPFIRPTEEEKRRRHLYGDKGAKFRKGKQYDPMTDGCTRTITTFENDNLLMEQQVQNIPPKPELPGNWIWNAERQKWVR